MLARHLEHVTVTDPPIDPLDLPALAEVLDRVPDPRDRRYRLGPLPAFAADASHTFRGGGTFALPCRGVMGAPADFGHVRVAEPLR
ncbi:hypothetical protein DMB42_51815 [Nonomuraea sp. WAC 01424]|nr:hypothetical protein DMB42_51815 [Nonomuraea sp. WAC 01424]